VDVVQLTKVSHDGPAAAAGVRAGETVPMSIDALVHADSIPGATGPVALKTIPWYLNAARNVAQRFPASPVKAIAIVFGVIFVLAVFGSVVRFFQEHLADRAAILAVNDIRTRLYDHILHVPMSFFGLKGTSDVTSRLVQDAQGLQDGFKTILGQTIQEPIKALLALSLSLYVSWQLTAFILIFAPLMGLLIKKFGKKMRRASRRAMQESSSMLGQVEGTLVGIRVVKAANAERFERRRYRNIMTGLVDQQIKMSRIDTLSTPTLETLTLLVIGAVVVFAAYLVKVKGSLSSAEFFLVMACLMGMAESLRKVSKINNHLQRANAAAGRIFEALDMPVERPRELERPMPMPRLTPTPNFEPGNLSGNGKTLAQTNAASVEPTAAPCFTTPGCRPRIKLPPVLREIRFENVTFSYANTTQPAVESVNLTVPKGQSVAVVGRNGSGKTTLLAMLPRFYDPASGRISIDGIDTRSVTLTSLRRQIGIVTQDAVIFPGTIGANIAYGMPLASRDAIENAAKRAFAHEFIMEKPNGYETVLGEMGGQLSGGQKQRINIARAILRASPILILDEATSQVDAESEHLIQQAIEGLMKDRTTFVIAHRFSTILSADTIVVMDRGRIVGQGQHDELLRTCPTYTQLYERQLFVPPAA
ncbi:MAG: ABC transporter ATP-binding protein/permease, partial [Planctomycetota bacterium]|nr:ABC transporter ATP-binding protein/permease [Planctomycetota bacterium]